MAESIVTWNVTNWVTVVIMVAVGFAVIALGTKLLRGGATQAAA